MLDRQIIESPSARVDDTSHIEQGVVVVELPGAHGHRPGRLVGREIIGRPQSDLDVIRCGTGGSPRQGKRPALCENCIPEDRTQFTNAAVGPHPHN